MAPSVGISVSVWQEAKALKTEDGELLIDIAEMDNITAIALMSLFFAMIPVLNTDTECFLCSRDTQDIAAKYPNHYYRSHKY